MRNYDLEFLKRFSLVILAIVSAAIVAFIIYTMTLGKIREIAVLKLIGTRNRTIAGMILQQALGLGLIGFVVGKVAATFWAPIFPKYVLLEPGDALALVSDGVTESSFADGRELGLDGMHRILAHAPADAAADALAQRIMDATGPLGIGGSEPDDRTVLIVRALP